jgi:tryptophan synthase beta subunit
LRVRERLAGRRVLIGLSGRGDKDLASVLPRLASEEESA